LHLCFFFIDFMDNLIIKDLGLISYADAYQIQTEIFTGLLEQKSENKKTQGTILFCEHPHVYTIGKSGERENLLISQDELQKLNAEFFSVDRGGDITYHGPGQMVVYPLIDLDNYKMGVKDYIYFLEYLIIDLLKEYGINSKISTGNIGVWLDVGKPSERKICSIGVKVSKKITMHGIALNVNTDLSYFNYINPCGFTEKGVSSLKNELSEEIDFEEIKNITKNILVRGLQNI